MHDRDTETEIFRGGVNCAALLEGWHPQHPEIPPRRRRSADRQPPGPGWWDPQSQAKGDVFDLVQFLDPSLNFGRVRQVLRRFVGIVPSCAAALAARQPPSVPTHDQRLTRYCRVPDAAISRITLRASVREG